METGVLISLLVHTKGDQPKNQAGKTAHNTVKVR